MEKIKRKEEQKLTLAGALKAANYQFTYVIHNYSNGVPSSL